MAVEDPSELDRVDREIRLNELRHRAAELAGGDLTAWDSEECPPEFTEHFWQHVAEFEATPLTCHLDLLRDSGLDLPDPDDLTDAELSDKLWELIHRLAEMNAFVSRTNHLSDRALYTQLVEDCLREAIPDLPPDEGSAHEIDLLGACSERDIQINLRYYASEQARQNWLKRYPDDDLPPRETPPHDRDRFLPKWKI